MAIASKILQRNVSKEDNERLIEETFRQIQSTYGFNIVDGNRSVDAINAELRKKISAVLAGG